MWAFKRHLARLPTMLNFTTTINNSYWRLGMATRSVPVCPGGSIFFTLHPPNSKSYQAFFNFCFFQKMRRSFLVRYRKARKNQSVSFYYISEKHEGRAKSAPPPSRARVNTCPMAMRMHFSWVALCCVTIRRDIIFIFCGRFVMDVEKLACLHHELFLVLF